MILFVDFSSSLFFAAVLLAAALTALPRSLPVLPSPLSRAHSLLSLSPAINIQDGGQSTSTRADATQGRKSSQSAPQDVTGPPIRARAQEQPKNKAFCAPPGPFQTDILTRGRPPDLLRFLRAISSSEHAPENCAETWIVFFSFGGDFPLPPFGSSLPLSALWCM